MSPPTAIQAKVLEDLDKRMYSAAGKDDDEAERIAKILIAKDDLPLFARCRALCILGVSKSPGYLEWAEEAVRTARKAITDPDTEEKEAQLMLASCETILHWALQDHSKDLERQWRAKKTEVSAAASCSATKTCSEGQRSVKKRRIKSGARDDVPDLLPAAPVMERTEEGTKIVELREMPSEEGNKTQVVGDSNAESPPSYSEGKGKARLVDVVLSRLDASFGGLSIDGQAAREDVLTFVFEEQ
ncbi:hypothetical protein BDY17DRAFT_186348 [Neohortaea acidophila]|uniref:Uncharacterized protein n=1 Tax=Neohortaea acidophila TaxID=245834 RepID=A0A6A6PNP8_9PEZI|nr:uncharacterized protein BDY17DRAFT_186348 [Neohortaea acidophila]KAF2481321.1 hypothetical protein BDY17DRAFT_186348 [Neohortaea acidophila]